MMESSFCNGYTWGRPFFSAGWRFTEESFMKILVVSNGKLRASGVNRQSIGVDT